VSKFEVGQIVECTSLKALRNGQGWKAGLVFRIGKISVDIEGNNIYWPGFDGHGVYEYALELYTPLGNSLADVIKSCVKELTS
jgi:hypothetical protein